jgi:DNA-binding PadR family transcriptional regulator
MAGKQGFGEFEQMVLLVVLRLGEQAFAPDIAAELERTADRPASRGALYSTLNRLEGKGWLTWSAEDAVEGRGGHIRRRFSLTAEGLGALRQRRATLLELWSGFESILDGGSR